MSYQLILIISLIFASYFLLNGLLFLFVPQRWCPYKWSLWPKQFLYMLDAPIGRLIIRGIGFMFTFQISRFLIDVGSSLLGRPFHFELPGVGLTAWVVMLIVAGLASLIAPNWMLDPKAHPQNRRLLRWVRRAFGVIILLVGIQYLARLSKPGFPAGVSTLTRQGVIAVMMILLGYLTLSGAMFFLAPRWWSTSGFAPAIFGDSAELDKPETLNRIRLRGLTMGSIGLVMLINIILFF